MTRPVMDKVGDLALRPEVVQAGIILQAVFYPLIQVGNGEYLGQDRSIWTGSIFKGDSSAARNYSLELMYLEKNAGSNPEILKKPG